MSELDVLDTHSTLYPSHPNYLLKAQSPNANTLGGRASTYEF